MYRFSLAESADPRSYVVAGAAAGSDTLAIQQALVRSTPDYAGLNKVGRNLAAVERVSDAKAELDKKLAEMGAKEYSSTRDLNDQRNKANNTQRFAGKLAAVGMLANELTRKEFEPSPPKPLDYSMFEQAVNNAKSRIQVLQDQINGLTQPEKPAILSDTGGEVSMNPSSPNSSTAARYALTNTIRRVEGTSGPDGYRIMFGGRKLDDMSKHPALVQHGGGHSSDAAGAYQFLSRTWNDVANKLGLTDFGPESQELAADYLIRQKGVDPNVRITNLEDWKNTSNRLAPTWAGLPYRDQKSKYPNQGQYTQEQVYDFYNQYLLDGLRKGLQ